MTQSDILKVVLAIPLLIASCFALIFLSYLLVPMVIVLVVGSIVYGAYQASVIDMRK